MKTISVNNFGGGMTNDIYHAGVGQFQSSRGFDIFAYPNRLHPTASMATDTASTAIGNLIVASDGVAYGLGTQSDNQSNGGLWYNTGGGWTFLSSSGGSPGPAYNFLVEYKKYSATKYILMGNTDATNTILAIDKTNNLSATVVGFTWTTLIQGFVHPKDNILYVAYKASATGNVIIGKLDGSSWTASAFTLPSRYTPVAMTWYGNYLAIACTTYTTGIVSGSSYDTSVIFLWDRDTTNSLPNESILLGDMNVQTLQNLNGVLIAIGPSDGVYNDYASLVIKGYAGGEPVILSQIYTTKQTTTAPSVTVNPRVNFIRRNRLYFSVDIVGGTTSPSYKGLWSFGKINGSWATTIERWATTDGSDASVIAAVFKGDNLYTVHTAEGTITKSAGSSSLATQYASSSVFETEVNPNMELFDSLSKKQLKSITVHYLPLPTTGQVVAKYRASSTASWTTCFTETTDGATATEVTDASGVPFSDSNEYQFRFESTGFAQIIGYTYQYELISTAQ